VFQSKVQDCVKYSYRRLHFICCLVTTVCELLRHFLIKLGNIGLTYDNSFVFILSFKRTVDFGIYVNFLNISKTFALVIASSIYFYWASRCFLKENKSHSCTIYKYGNSLAIIEFSF